MSKSKKLYLGILIFVVLFVAGCSGNQATESGSPNEELSEDVINREGRRQDIETEELDEAGNEASLTEYSTYVNPRYGFSISYPRDFLAQDPPDNGDGQVFVSRDGFAELRVYGSHNIFESSLETLFNEELARVSGNIAYQKVKDNWYVVSWWNGSTIFYTKTFVGEAAVNTFIFSYPQSEKDFYNKVTDHISSSFSPGALD